MWRIGFVGLIATLVAADPALAQAGRISGTVTSTDGTAPVGGAQVRVLGTTLGAVTGDDGRYVVSAVPPGTYGVRVTRIGFTPDSLTGVVVRSDETATADFRLKPAATVLTGMVVIGYGTAQARDRTGSVDVVSSEQFNTGRVVSPEQLIQAKVAGVQVITNNEPGAGIAVRIRGASSVTSSSDPLYVVDGVPLQVGGGASAGRNPLNFLNPSDIESITVLKDASAAAIYGSRGSNGVVIVRTKGGRQGTQFEFSSSVSQSKVTGGPDLLDAAQFRSAVQNFASENVSKLGAANTDWRDAIERNGTGNEQQLSVAGGREDLNYRLALGYLDQKGVVESSGLRRLSTSLSYGDKLFNNIDVTAHLKGSRTDDRFTPNDVIGNATSFDPTAPIRTSSGSYFQFGDTRAPGNPLAQLALVTDRGTTYRSVGNLETKYHTPFLEGLTATLNLGYDVATARRTRFNPSTERTQIISGDSGTLYRNNPAQLNTVLDLYGNYVRSFEQYHSDFDLTAGYSYEGARGDTSTITAKGLSSDLLGSSGIPTSTKPLNTLFVDESRLVSFFGRLNYTFRDKYLTTLSVRRDGSSKFGEGNRWGVFPAAAFAWRIADEPFMRRFSSINDLKLRLSWGVNGNQAFPNYQAISSYTIGNGLAQALFGNEFVSTIRPSAVDPDLKWEQTTSYNVGFDYGILNNRVSGTIDYYFKKTKDLIFTVPVAAGTNLSDFVTTNIGSLQNRGLELGLNAPILSDFHGLRWDASFNASTNRNKLLRINAFGTGKERIGIGGISGGVGNTIQVLQAGEPINSFLVYKHKMKNGKPIYEDVNGDNAINEQDLYEDLNGDKQVDIADLRAYKNPAPKWILGHSSNLTFGNFDGSFTLRAYLGNYMYNNVASNLGNYSRIRGSGTPINLHASVLEYGFGDPQYFSDVYIEDASFLRMDNITLGYTFNRLRAVRALRLFGTVQNVFTVTDYSGVDPAASYIDTFNHQIYQGIDNNVYPRSRTFLTGASIQF